MNSYADAAELAWSEFQRQATGNESTGRVENARTAMRHFFQKELIPEVKRAAIEINANHGALHASCVLFPNEQFPQSIELVIEPRCGKLENYISFRIEPDSFGGNGISCYASDNPICKRIREPRLDLFQDIILKFISSSFTG
jgi:hypothetical protein